MIKPVLAITMGDPGGIGPEIGLKALADPRLEEFCVPALVGSEALLRSTAKTLGLPFKARVISGAVPPPTGMTQACVIDIPFEELEEVHPGRPSAASGKAAYRYIEAALRWTLDKRFAGIVTGPLSKEALSLAGIPFPGHTEILAALSGVPEATLMLWSPRLAVSFATLHRALAEVPGALSVAGLVRTIQRTAAFVEQLKGQPGRLGLLALNPHAGEAGLFGREEKEILLPALESARKEGLDLRGPLVPDVAFTESSRNQFDAFVCLYHDQGGIPFKMLSFEDGVNVTLGLPLIRTSVDHGTAYDLVGKGRASAESLVSACRLAATLAGKAKPGR